MDFLFVLIGIIFSFAIFGMVIRLFIKNVRGGKARGIDWESELRRVRDRIYEKLNIDESVVWEPFDKGGEARLPDGHEGLGEGYGDSPMAGVFGWQMEQEGASMEFPESRFPHTEGYHTYEDAYEEEGMGEHTAQGDAERHRVRPVWQEAESQAREVANFQRMGLRNAMIVSEILGPPLSKKRRG